MTADNGSGLPTEAEETAADRKRRLAAARMVRWRARQRTGRRPATINPTIADELPDDRETFDAEVNRLLGLALDMERNGSVTPPRTRSR